MSTVDEAWAKIYLPLQNLKQNTVDTAWDAYREQFLGELDVGDPIVAELVHRLDEMPDDDRAELMAGDQLDTFAYQVIQESAVPETVAGGYDEMVWADFLATNGVAWDGSEESWPTFREWFVYHANEAGVSMPATELLDYLETQQAGERVRTFAGYGVVIASRVGSRPDDDHGLAAVLADGLAAVPGANELSQNDIDEVMARVREAMRAEGMAK